MLPVSALLLVAPGHALWVREYASSFDQLRRFAVSDSTGQGLGDGTRPARSRPSRVASDFVLGSWNDPDYVDTSGSTA